MSSQNQNPNEPKEIGHEDGNANEGVNSSNPMNGSTAGAGATASQLPFPSAVSNLSQQSSSQPMVMAPGVAQLLSQQMFASMVQSQMARLRNHFVTNQPQQQQQPQQQPFPFNNNQQQQFLQQLQFQQQQQQQQPPIYKQQNNGTSCQASGRQAPQSTLPTAASATMPEPDSRTTSGICKVLALDQDYREISPYQCLVRENIELFEQPENYQESKQGRNRPVLPGQVGIRCRHCGTRPQFHTRGSMLFPTTLLGLYQTAQNLANTHLLKTCLLIPDETRRELLRVRSREAGKKTRKSSYGGGRQYWAASLGVLGVIETPDRGLAFKSRSTGDNGESKSVKKESESVNSER